MDGTTIVPISWIGVRSMLQTPEPFKFSGNVHMRGILQAGYSPELNAPLFTVGASVLLMRKKP